MRIPLKKNSRVYFFLLLSLLFSILVFGKMSRSYFSLVPLEITEKSNPKSTPTIVFKDKTLETGLLASHQQTTKVLTSIQQLIGGGICVLDVNNDGWQDLFIIGGSGEHRFYGRQTWWKNKVAQTNTLWLNNEGRTFENITVTSNLSTHLYPMGCSAGDLDNDGDEDLLVTNIGQNQIYENLGGGVFKDRTENSGLQDLKNWSTSASMADFDNDGLLDIYVTNFIDFQQGKKVFEQASGFVGSVNDSLNPILYESESNYLLKNKGHFQFNEVAVSQGVQDNSGRGVAARWFDINQDNYPDLLVVNSAGSPQRLFINQRPANQGFEESARHYNLSHSDGSHSIAIGDTNLDGYQDLLLSSPAGFPPKLYTHTRLEPFKSNSSISQQLYESSWESGIADNRLLYMFGWGAVLSDFNNDMFPDLFIGNGATSIDSDAPSLSIGQPNQLWVNKNGLFRSELLLSDNTAPTRGVINLDINNDGKMDIVTTQNNDYVSVLINESDLDAPWIDVELKHPKKLSNGAKVTLTFESQQSKTNQQIITSAFQPSSFLSQSTSRLHFALPPSVNMVDIEVLWPDNTITRYPSLEVNRIWQLKNAEEASILTNQTSDQTSEISTKTVSDKPWLSMLSEKQQSQLIQSIEGAILSSSNMQPDVNALMYRELDYLFTHVDSSLHTRNTIVQALTSASFTRDSLSLKFIERALVSSDDKIRIAGIKALMQQEHEISIRRLIRMDKDASPKVRCKIANTFKHFFHEEEAVVRRKGLANSHLIFMLSAKEESVKLCTIEALAEAENYRAVVPLIALATQPSSSEKVTIAAIRALGLIRDIKAVPELFRLLETESSARVKAATLIALKRLGYENFQSLIAQLLDFEHNGTQSINVAVALLHDNQLDSLVLKPDVIWQPLESTLNKLERLQLTIEDQILAALDLLILSDRNRKREILENYLTSDKSSIADKAATHLASISPSDEDTTKWRFADRTIKAQKHIIKKLIQRQHVFSKKELSDFLRNEETTQALLYSLKTYKYPKLLSLLKSIPIELINSENSRWLKLCDYQTKLTGTISLSWLENRPTSYQALNCWLKTDSNVASSPPLSFLKKLIPSAPLSTEMVSSRLTTVIEAIANHPTYEADRVLIELIKHHHILKVRKTALAIGLAFKKPYALDLAMHYAKAATRDVMTEFSQIQLTSAVPTDFQAHKFYDYLKIIAFSPEIPFDKRWAAMFKLIQDGQATLESFLL